ncbi:MAG: 4-alpha-glucanotransferase [Eubacteriales bacterium]|nr:4-alpha-glucanotransferase [Eubacteriales bacterium]
MNREAGILLSITSLPSQYGIGCFSKSAYDFVDWLRGAGQSCWQVLPLGPTGYGDSPYQSFSTFAGNPYFISLEDLMGEGLLTEEECSCAKAEEKPETIDYGQLYKTRYPLLRLAFERSDIGKNRKYQEFVEENRWWLSDYALFMAVKERFDGAPWTEWPEEIRLRRDNAMEEFRRALSSEVRFHQFLQFTFYKQWWALKDYANKQGIKIIGDLPIYVAMDSADVWANPRLFQLNENNCPTAVAGCPPDGFAPEGQLWGNPLYRWEYHRQTGFSWWLSRLAHAFRLYDVVRIDHFRGFDAYYSIPYGAKTAAEGHWEKGVGMELFHKMREAMGRQSIIAEDLGYMTDSVKELLAESGFPGMKVLEFAFDARDTGCAGDYLPHNYPENAVAYTGTHDNETIAGWFRSITQEERQLARAYLCDFYTPQEYLYRSFISLVMASKAMLCIIPMQDYMGKDNRARMNRPSTVGQNWKWRVREEELTDALREEIRSMTRRYGRLNEQWDDVLDQKNR